MWCMCFPGDQQREGHAHGDADVTAGELNAPAETGEFQRTQSSSVLVDPRAYYFIDACTSGNMMVLLDPCGTLWIHVRTTDYMGC
jgi:hypothetical protein